MKLQLSPKFLLVLNSLATALMVAAIVMLYQMDMIVHGTLYNYGLGFDLEWAIPYWTFERLMLIMLGIVGAVQVLSVFNLIVSQKALSKETPDSRVRTARVPVQREAREKVQKPRLTAREERVPPQSSVVAREESALREVRDDGVEVMALPMVCNKCGKVFTQPLCMFDFASGKPRLVNVCPYCNAVLAVSGNSKSR